MTIELLSVERDLRPYRFLDFTAEVTGSEFNFLVTDGGSWCWWLQSPLSGSRTYRVDLDEPDGCGGQDPTHFRTQSNVERLEFKNQGQSQQQIAVTAITLVDQKPSHHRERASHVGDTWTVGERETIGDERRLTNLPPRRIPETVEPRVVGAWWLEPREGATTGAWRARSANHPIPDETSATCASVPFPLD